MRLLASFEVVVLPTAFRRGTVPAAAETGHPPGTLQPAHSLVAKSTPPVKGRLKERLLGNVQLMSPRVRRLIVFHSIRAFSAFHTNDGGSTNPAGRGMGIRMYTRYSGSSIVGSFCGCS